MDRYTVETTLDRSNGSVAAFCIYDTKVRAQRSGMIGDTRVSSVYKTKAEAQAVADKINEK